MYSDQEIRQYTSEAEKVRIKAVEMEAFLASVGFSLKIIICDEFRGKRIDTLATDGKSILINPDFMMKSTIGKRIVTFVHEMFHAAFGHSLRRGWRDPDFWNIACDEEVNNLINNSGRYETPDDWVRSDKYNGWVAERIYADMTKDIPKDGGATGDGDGSGDDGDTAGIVCDDPGNDPDDNNSEECVQDAHDGDDSDDESSKGSDSSDEGDEDQDVLEDEGSSSGEEQGEVGSSKSDSDAPSKGGSDSNKDNTGSKYSDGKQVGIIFDQLNEDGSEMSKDDKDKALAELSKDREIGKMAEIMAGTDGKIGASMSVQRMSGPKDSWETQISNFFSKRGSPEGTTWRKLNRRSLARGIYQPSRRYQGIDWMVFAYDVSWSMDVAALNALNNKMEDMRKECSIKRITIIPFTTYVHESAIVDLDGGDPIPTEWNVGGGTSFRPIFDWVRRQDGDPDGVMVFTDLGSRAYGEAVDGVPTLWVTSEPVFSYPDQYGGSYTNAPPFGEVVEVEVSA